MSEHHYIACDLGADSGRVILGTLREGKITLEEVHRFSNGASKINGSLRWNILRIFEELKAGLRKVAEKKVSAESLSVDSWGVDYVLFNQRQPLLALPWHYRDSRTDVPYAATRQRVGDATLFEQTGLQFLSFNTLFQLIDDVENNSDVISIADSFLNIADYLNYLFSGVALQEESNASTTQIYNPKTRNWSKELIAACHLPERIFPQIVPSGTPIGKLLPAIQEETGLNEIPVVATCSHDTGAAVAAVPAEGEGWAYLSSGTWSLVGVELPAPLINEQVRCFNFTNEAGYGGTTRFLKNIVGLWLLQESRRDWIRQGMALSFDDLDRQAEAAEPFRSLINPNAACFLKPDNMPAKIAAYCRETGQLAPETPGQVTRCIFESLALSYRQMLAQIEQLTGQTITRLHIVGGGSKSSLLNQYAANGTGRTVFTGPVEATACGNILIQALALGHIDSLKALRKTVRESFEITPYQPQGSEQWAAAFERFSQLNLA
ncbi:MAG: rhamnulokinase [Verrucomicrobia bacterium]|nr:rhamnulokinase [Verrucomicrobiota bacterium]